MEAAISLAMGRLLHAKLGPTVGAIPRCKEDPRPGLCLRGGRALSPGAEEPAARRGPGPSEAQEALTAGPWHPVRHLGRLDGALLPGTSELPEVFERAMQMHRSSEALAFASSV